jgi:hypothetical protein
MPRFDPSWVRAELAAMPPVFISRYRPLRQVMGIPFEAGRGNARGPDQFCSGSVIRSGFQRIHLREMIGSLLSPSRGARCHFEAARGGLTFLELVPVSAGVPFSSRLSRPGFFDHSGQRRPQRCRPPCYRPCLRCMRHRWLQLIILPLWKGSRSRCSARRRRCSFPELIH